MLLEQSQLAAAHAAIGRSCHLLDDERFDEWLAMCTQDVSYSIRAYSPEIRREMTWLKHDRAGLEQMLGTLRLHQRDSGDLFRHPSVLKMERDIDGSLDTMTAVLIYRTAQDGMSSLFAAARYFDTWEAGSDQLLLKARRVQLATRVLMSDSGGSHVPL